MDVEFSSYDYWKTLTTLEEYVGRNHDMGSDYPIVCIYNKKFLVVHALKAFLEEEVDSHHIVPIIKDWHEGTM